MLIDDAIYAVVFISTRCLTVKFQRKKKKKEKQGSSLLICSLLGGETNYVKFDLT